MDSLTRIILIIVLLLVSSFFSLTESSFSYANQFKLKVAEDEGSKSAKLVLKCLNNFDKYIITNLICNNVLHILFSVFVTVLTVSLLNNTSLANLASLDDIAALISTIASTILVFFIGEIIPKNIGKAFPNQISCAFVYPIYAIEIILTPISIIFLLLNKLVRKIFKQEKEDVLIDEEDFQDIVDSIEEEGLIEEQESEIIQSAVEFDDMKVKQVMCPRENICALDLNQNLNKDQLIDFILDNPFTRIPVYRDNIDNIIGILHTQKFLRQLMNSNSYDIEELLVEPIFVKPNVHLDTIFEEFRKKRSHMGVVVDKDDNTIGIVTMEDVLEELVGDIDESKELLMNGGDNNDE